MVGTSAKVNDGSRAFKYAIASATCNSPVYWKVGGIGINSYSDGIKQLGLICAGAGLMITYQCLSLGSLSKSLFLNLSLAM